MHNTKRYHEYFFLIKYTKWKANAGINMKRKECLWIIVIDLI